MLIIRDEQMSAMSSALTKTFERLIAADLKSAHPELKPQWSDSDFTRHASESIDCALAYRITDFDGMALIAHLRVEFGPSFDEISPFREVLASELSQAAKVSELAARANNAKPREDTLRE